MKNDIFHSERFFLRAFEPEDVQAIFEYLNHPGLNGRRYIPWKFSDTLPLSKSQVGAILESWEDSEKQFHLAVVLNGEEQLIGHVNADWRWDPHCPNIDLVIAPAFQCQGYGGEVLEMILAYFFEHTQAYNLGGGMDEWNQAARTFASAHGFKECGRMRRAGIRRGVYFDWIGVDIIRPEWVAKKGA
jgi:RimJ/RimL family protein N-acetyltransferase